MTTEQVSCAWNDVTCLVDERAVTFVCKTLFQLLLEEDLPVEQLVQLELEKLSCQEPQGILAGQILLQAVCTTKDGEERVYPLVIPFAADQLEGRQYGHLNVHYIQGQLIEDKLWVETVVSGIRLELSRDGQVILGEVALREVLDLPGQLPGCEQLISAQVISNIEHMELLEGVRVQVAGHHLLSVLYEGRRKAGEKLHVYQQTCPFQGEIELGHQLADLNGAVLHYRLLTAQLLEERKLMISGVGMIKTLAVEEQEDVAEQDCLLTEGEVVERRTPVEAVPVRPERERVEPVVESAKNNSSVAVEKAVRRGSRISQRTQLSKYMRELDGMVRGPKSMRNFDLQDK